MQPGLGKRKPSQEVVLIFGLLTGGRNFPEQNAAQVLAPLHSGKSFYVSLTATKANQSLIS